MTKEERINEELRRLNAIYADLPTNRLTLVQGLIQNCAFMKVSLDDLQEIINGSGCSETYRNGENQFGRKASADLQAYNSLLRNYTIAIAKLDKMLPAEKKKSKLDEMTDE